MIDWVGFLGQYGVFHGLLLASLIGLGWFVRREVSIAKGAMVDACRAITVIERSIRERSMPKKVIYRTDLVKQVGEVHDLLRECYERLDVMCKWIEDNKGDG